MTSEVWRECVAWLTRCGVIRKDHKLNWPDCTPIEFAHTLRDGVLLCNLLHMLDPAVFDMKDVNQKPQMAQFLCLRNIKTFLQACHNIYQVPLADLFEPNMLFDLSDFQKVLFTLSRLSNTPKFKAKGISGFCAEKLKIPAQEELYKNINVGWADAHFLFPRHHPIPLHTHAHAQLHPSDAHEEIVYHRLCSPRPKESRLQPIPASILQKPIQAPSLEKRDYVINELVETEKNYVDVLASLQKSFMRPLTHILSEPDFAVIFFGIKELSEVHTPFHAQLRQACAGNSNLKLSEVFLSWRLKFIIYGDYCANLTAAQQRIQQICAKSEVTKQEIERCQQEQSHGKFKLRDILSVPMQRILKYHLLLDKLLAETQTSHEDFRGLERAMEAMVDVAQYINEVKRDSDTLHIISDIQESIVDWNMAPCADQAQLKDFGHLLKDGEIKIRMYGEPKIKIRYAFVFDQAILLCKPLRGDQYNLKGLLALQEYRLEEICAVRDGGAPICKLNGSLSREPSGRWRYLFALVNKSNDSIQYTFYTRTDDIRSKWMTAIRDAMDNIDPAVARSSEHNLVIQTFDKPTICNYCSKFLKGRILQGYRCAKCYIAVHKACIANSRRCGCAHRSNSLAPIVPPRPTSATDSENLLQFSPTLPPPAPPVNGWNVPASNLGWMQPEDLLSEYLWFVGEMGREKAAATLEKEPDGTFLVRFRPQGPANVGESIYALSLKTNNTVKHMKVYEKKYDDGTTQLYLSESRFFPNIVELVSCYEQTSLAENFVGLNVCLGLPYRRISAVVEFDFNPTESNQLPLKKGSHVLVLSKEGDHKGWWKGRIQDRVGFFPKVYVREIGSNILH